MGKINTESNFYTLLFAAGMVIAVASLLAFTASALKDLQGENVRKEKMQNILETVGIETTRDQAQELYDRYIIEQISLDSQGEIDPETDAFTVNLATELKKPIEEQRFPIFIADYEGERFYIIPLRGSGLWDAIWGYIALKEDRKTVKGAVFDHKGETAGLGAEITKEWFMNQFRDELLFDQDGQFQGINVSKTNNDPENIDKMDHEVDAISGSTITGDGVSDMIKERLQHYLSYLNN